MCAASVPSLKLVGNVGVGSAALPFHRGFGPCGHADSEQLPHHHEALDRSPAQAY